MKKKHTYFGYQIKIGPFLKFHIPGPVLYLSTVCIPDFTTQLQNYHTKLKTCQLRSDKVIEMTGFEFTVNWKDTLPILTSTDFVM